MELDVEYLIVGGGGGDGSTGARPAVGGGSGGGGSGLDGTHSPGLDAGTLGIGYKGGNGFVTASGRGPGGGGGGAGGLGFPATSGTVAGKGGIGYLSSPALSADDSGRRERWTTCPQWLRYRRCRRVRDALYCRYRRPLSFIDSLFHCFIQLCRHSSTGTLERPLTPTLSWIHFTDLLTRHWPVFVMRHRPASRHTPMTSVVRRKRVYTRRSFSAAWTRQGERPRIERIPWLNQVTPRKSRLPPSCRRPLTTMLARPACPSRTRAT